MHDDEVEVDEALVRRLLAAQMPHLADRPLSMVEPWGTDNGIWRLGDDLVVRLPRIGWAEGQVTRDATWLPRLAPHLPVAVPEPVAVGEPADGYPYRWAVHRWIPGDGAALDTIDDPVAFALDLADFVRQLQRVPTDGAPAARNRARPLSDYDERHAPSHRPCEPPDRRRRGHGGVGGGAGRGPARRPARLGPRRPRGELPRARRSTVRHRRLGLGLRGRPRCRRAGRLVAAVHRGVSNGLPRTPSTSTTPRSPAAEARRSTRHAPPCRTTCTPIR